MISSVLLLQGQKAYSSDNPVFPGKNKNTISKINVGLPEKPKGKILPAGPVAAPPDFSSDEVPPALRKKGYKKLTQDWTHNNKPSGDAIIYFDYSSVSLPCEIGLGNIKIVFNAKNESFSQSSTWFFQADTINTGAKTVKFTIPAFLAKYNAKYSFAISNAADLAIVNIGPASVKPGENTHYRLQVSNTGPAHVRNAVVKMPAAPGFVFQSMHAGALGGEGAVTIGPDNSSLNTGNLESGITIPFLPSGGGVMFDIYYKANGSEGTKVSATASVIAPSCIADPDDTNNTSTRFTEVFTPDANRISRYEMQAQVTINEAGNKAIERGSDIDMIYQLVSGPVIPELGNKFTIPLTFTSLDRTSSNASLNNWYNYSPDSYRTFNIGLVSDNSSNSIMNELPPNNKRNFYSDSYRDLPSGWSCDSSYNFLLTKGFLNRLGGFNVKIGGLPAITSPGVKVIADTIAIYTYNHLAWIKPITVPQVFVKGYFLRMLGTTTVNQHSYTPNGNTDSVRHNATYPFIYTAFSGNGEGFDNDATRGLRIAIGSVMFSSPTPLPVNLLSFEAYRTNNTVQLNWSTSSEVGTRSFEVERSADGKNFVTIGTLSAANSPGNHNYSFNDQSPLNGNNVYRLKMIDIDNASTYSEMKAVAFNTTSLLTISPNPAKNVVYVKNAPVDATIKLVDLTGRVLQQITITSTNQTIDISKCANGMYVVQIVQNNETIHSVRIIKQ